MKRYEFKRAQGTDTALVIWEASGTSFSRKEYIELTLKEVLKAEMAKVKKEFYTIFKSQPVSKENSYNIREEALRRLKESMLVRGDKAYMLVKEDNHWFGKSNIEPDLELPPDWVEYAVNPKSSESLTEVLC